MAKGHDKLTADGKKFFAELQRLTNQEVRVGYKRGKATGDYGVDMVDIAVHNELGTENIPARPFMRNSVDNNKSQIKYMAKKQLERITKGQATADEALEDIGILQMMLIQEQIDLGELEFKDNATSTINKKGRNEPLTDTGRLAESVDFEIIPKGSED